MKILRFSLLFILLAVLTPVHAKAQESALVRLSYSSGWDALPAIVAIERGFFAQEGLVVSGMPMTSASTVMTSLVAGSTDVVAVPQRTLIIMAAANLPVKVIGMSGWGTEIDLVVSKDNKAVESLADLKGKTIAVGLGSEAFAALVRLLNASGLRPTDVKINRLAGQQLLAAFKDKTTDAVFESRHYTSTLVENGDARIVVSDGSIRKALGSISAMPLVASKAFVEREPGTAQKFMNAWVKALVYIQQDPEDAARLLQIFLHREGTPVNTKLAAAWVKYTHYDRYSWSEADVLDAEYNGWGLKEGGILKVQPKLAGLIENSFANTAVKSILKPAE